MIWLALYSSSIGEHLCSMKLPIFLLLEFLDIIFREYHLALSCYVLTTHWCKLANNQKPTGIIKPINRMLPQSGKCLLLTWSKDIMLLPDPKISYILACIWNVITWSITTPLKTSFSNSSFSWGQYTVPFACSLHLLRPRCPLCINFSMASCFLAGMKTLGTFED